MRMRSERGFSAVELLIVISILLILAGMAFPDFGPAVRRFQMEGRAKAVTALINRARNEAMRLNRRVCTGWVQYYTGTKWEYRYVLNTRTTDPDGDPCNDPTTQYDGPQPGIAGESYVSLPGPGTASGGGVTVYQYQYPTIWFCLNGMPPGYCGASPVWPIPWDRITFSPRGTLEVWNGVAYQQTQQVFGFYNYYYYYNAATLKWEYDYYISTVTPYGTTKVFRYNRQASGAWAMVEM